MSDGAATRVRDEVAALAAAALPSARGEADVAALLARVEDVVGRALAARPAGAPRPACARGCATCCTVNVATLALEGIAAAHLLRQRLGAAAAAALAPGLHAFHGRIRWLEDRERILDRLACPLLADDGACGIHPARPLVCRGLTSLDAGECRAAIAAAAAEEPAVVRVDLLQHELYADAFAALAEALARRGLDARRRDVSGMTACFLADPSLAPAFLAGRRVPLD
jgi:Fe-S-cluster containining protein